MEWPRSGRDGSVAARRCVELTGEARPAELARHALDEIIDHLLRDVRHLYGEIVDLRLEVVVRPHHRNRDEQTVSSRGERSGEATTKSGRIPGIDAGQAVGSIIR